MSPLRLFPLPLLVLFLNMSTGLCKAITLSEESTIRILFSGQDPASTPRFRSATRPGGATVISGIINRYARILSYDPTSNIATIDTPLWFPCGSLTLVIQMNGALCESGNDPSYGTILEYNGAGSFEFTRVTSITANTISFFPPLRPGYDFTAAVQLVTVPTYSHARVTGTLLPSMWNGWKGGVIALVADTLSLDADIDAAARGFSGGSRSVNIAHNSIPDYMQDPATGKGGFKGEGIFVVAPGSNSARGAAANGGGGGNGHNSGGAGGGGGGAGGRGGYQHNGAGSGDFGGVGGRALLFGSAVQPRAFFGGGGGGGHQNDNRGTSGERGGGIVIVSAHVLEGNGHSIIVDGASQTLVAGNDGGGGGGSAGTICFNADTVLSPLALLARGGKGGDVDNNNNRTQCHGPGGGGAGGAICHAESSLPALVSTSVAGGLSGMNVRYPSPCLNTADGAVEGSDGIVVPNITLPRYRTSARTLTVELPDTLILCPDSCVMLRAAVAGGLPAYRYSWSPARVFSVPWDQEPVLCPDSTMECTLTVTDSCGATISKRFLVLVDDVPDLRLQRRGDTLTAWPAGLRYQWRRNGIAIPGATEQSLIAFLSGRYSVEAWTSGNCPVLSSEVMVSKSLPSMTVSLECPQQTLVAAGERVMLNARLALPIAFALTLFDRMTLWMSARDGVLAPANPQEIQISTAGTSLVMQCTWDVASTLDTFLIVPLEFIATLGDTACTRVSLDSMALSGDSARVILAADGCEICVKLCEEGGQRLFLETVKATLAQNHPNPFNTTTAIEYTLIEKGPMRLVVHDRLGREVALLDAGHREPGSYRAVFDASSLPSGVYTVTLVSPTLTVQRAMVLMK